MLKQAKKIKKQVVQIIEKDGERFWHSDVVGWVPQSAIEMNAKEFSVGTKITIEYERETVTPSQ